MSRHESSDCHKEAVQGMIVRPQTARDIGEQLSEIHSCEKRDNRQLILKILQNIRFLTHQNISMMNLRATLFKCLNSEVKMILEFSSGWSEKQINIQVRKYKIRCYKLWL